MKAMRNNRFVYGEGQYSYAKRPQPELWDEYREYIVKNKPKFTGIFYNYIPSYVGDGIESETIQDPFRRTKLIG